MKLNQPQPAQIHQNGDRFVCSDLCGEFASERWNRSHRSHKTFDRPPHELSIHVHITPIEHQ
jgi:hypothetical protein